jgi:hypothetical protein
MIYASRIFLYLLPGLAALWAGCRSTREEGQGPEGRPNSLFVISDDQSRLHAGAYGDPRITGDDPWQAYIYHQTHGFGAVYNLSLPDYERKRAALRPSHHPRWEID